MTLVRWFEKSHICSECRTEWTDEWSCTCNDRCPNCHLESSPVCVRDLSRELLPEDYNGARRLLDLRAEASVSRAPLTANAEQARDYAEAKLEGRSLLD